MNQPTLRPLRRSRRGATLVESAVVLLTLLVIVLGMLDFGLAVLRRNSLAEAARRLARTAIVRGDAAEPEIVWGPTLHVGTAADEDDMAAAVRPVLTAMRPGEVALRLEWIDGDNRLDQRVRVSVEYQHRSAVPFIFGTRGLQLSAVSVMRIVR